MHHHASEPQTLTPLSTPLNISIESACSEPIIIPPPSNISNFSVHPLEVKIISHSPLLMELFQHRPYFSSMPSVPKVRECLSLDTLEQREDDTSPLSLLSLPGNVREALQLVIASGELDLSEVELNQVNMPEAWVPVEAFK